MKNLYRIIDANSDRVREALRVIEDFARFHMDSGELSLELKRLRHGFCAAVAELGDALVSAREVQGDVGMREKKSESPARESEFDVLTANFKRLQEALRSIEEYLKPVDARLSRRIHDIRFGTYGLEQRFWRECNPVARLRNVRLYAIVSSDVSGRDVVSAATDAIASGVEAIQLREKTMPDSEFLRLAMRLRRLTAAKGVLFIVNDRADIAIACDADGVHVGDDDVPVEVARRLLGPGKIVGATAHSAREALKLVREGADYVSAGPVFSAATKFRHMKTSNRPELDSTGLGILKEYSRKVKVPFFAIGGIDSSNIRRVVAAGGRRVAVCAGIFAQADVANAAKRLGSFLR
jgi:thiamine-phosphate pyrophosphorylase